MLVIDHLESRAPPNRHGKPSPAGGGGGGGKAALPGGGAGKHPHDELRVAHLNGHNKFCDNKISTSKYSAFSFIPRSLFEQ